MALCNFDLEGFPASCFLDFKNKSDNENPFFSGLILCRPVVPVGAILSDLLTLSQPGGADYAHHITTSTPGFKNLTTSLI